MVGVVELVPLATPSRQRICAVAANPALDRVAVAPGAAVGGTVLADSYEETPGGKAVHAASASAALGGDVELVALLGGDRGRQVGALLSSERRVTCRVVAIEGETRGSYTLVDSTEGDVVEVIEPSPRVTDREVEELHAAVAGCVNKAGVVFAAGSLPLGVGEDFYATVVQLGRAAGALVLIDGRGAPLTHALGAGPDLVKPNLAEACALTGRLVADDAPIAKLLEIAADLLARGARNVWLTLGSRGSLLLDHHGAAWCLSLPPRRVVSAVGCGDALLGGLATGLSHGLGLLDAARLGTAAAGEKLSRAHPGHVDGDGAAALVSRVQIEQLA